MTTIATDGKTIAADSLSIGSFKLQKPVKKMIRLNDGRVLALTGAHWETQAMADWLNGQREKPKIGEGHGALVLGEKLILYDDDLEPMEVPAPYAIGCGCDFAMGAMLAGASPREAVKIAARLDQNTGGPVRIMSYAPSRPKA